MKPRGVLEIRQAILECISEGFGDYEIHSLVPEVRGYANPIKYIKMLRDYK